MKFYKLACTLALAALACGFNSALAAEPVQLASIKADTDGNGTQETAELWGTRLTDGSSYYGDLLLMIKDGGKLVTAYNPSLKGGYALLLEKANFTGKGEQLIVRGISGASTAAEVRIIDAAKPDEVKEIYTGADNLGVAVNGAFTPGFTARLTYGGETEEITLPQEQSYYTDRGIYNEAGEVLKPYRTPRSAMQGVTVTPAEGGTDALSTLQVVTGADGGDVLAKIAARWQYNEGWQLQQQELYTQFAQNEKFRRNIKFDGAMLYAQQAVAHGNSITYPLLAVEENVSLQNAVNEELTKVWQPYTRALYSNICELDYTVPFTGQHLMSVIFFGVMGAGDAEIFERLPLNFDMATGKVLEITDVLDAGNPDLLPVLALLGAEDKVDFSQGLPNSWYYNGKNMVFCQKTADGMGWNETAIAASELEAFMLNTDLLKK